MNFNRTLFTLMVGAFFFLLGCDPAPPSEEPPKEESGPTCGNGEVEGDEACDDGNEEDGDACSNACVSNLCGNSVLDEEEGCDDGNIANGDGCPSNCSEIEAGFLCLFPGIPCSDIRPDLADGECFMEYNLDQTGDGVRDYTAQVVYTANADWAEYRILSGSTVLMRIVYTYDSAGNQIEQTQYDAGELSSKATRTFDENDNMLTLVEDNSGDGLTDRTVTMAYDSDGNRLTYTEDEDGDGSDDSFVSFTYNEDGQVLSFESDDNVDGFIDYSGASTYAEQDGNTVQTSSTTRNWRPSTITYTWSDLDESTSTQIDYNSDGSIDRVSNATFDSDGKIATREVDWENDGTIDRIFRVTGTNSSGRIQALSAETPDGTALFTQSYTYNGAGKVTQLTQKDRNNDTTYASYYTYDENNRILTQKINNDDDPAWDVEYTMERDDQDRDILWGMNALTNLDDPDTPETQYESTTWDDSGYALTGTIHSGHDDELDQSFTYTYDERGNTLTSILEGSGDTLPDYVETTTYGEEDRILNQIKDFWADGTQDDVSDYTYDSEGRALTYTQDTSGDGEPNNAWVQSYDENGHVTFFGRDRDGNGQDDFSITSRSACVTK